MRRNAPLIALLVTSVVVLVCGWRYLRGPDGTPLSAEFPRVDGLKDGAAVLYRGVPIGEVQSVTLVAAGVRVRFHVTRPGVTIRTSDTLWIRPIGVFGDHFVDVTPGAQTAAAADSSTVLLGRPGELPGSFTLDSLAHLLRAADSTSARARAGAGRP